MGLQIGSVDANANGEADAVADCDVLGVVVVAVLVPQCLPWHATHCSEYGWQTGAVVDSLHGHYNCNVERNYLQHAAVILVSVSHFSMKYLIACNPSPPPTLTQFHTLSWWYFE